jgi:minor extracellular serine protease Vpr
LLTKNAFLAVVFGALPFYAAAQISNPALVSSDLYAGTAGNVTSPRSSFQATGRVQVLLRLQLPPLVVAVGAGAKQKGITMTAAQQQAYLAQIKQQQDQVMAQVAAQGGVEIVRVSKAHNAVAVGIDASKLSALRKIAAVTAIRPVIDINFTPKAQQPDLPTTLPYIGAASVQSSGYTGAGIKVAVLDTGTDYTHYNLGGSGNIADYQTAKAAASTTPPPSLFPTAKIIGGIDFAGDVWPNGPLATDPNPIDLNGHGTHTSDIVGGRSLDGVHKGVAPDSKMYAVKVCSSVSSSCSGLAMLEGLDFSLDPNNTGTLNSPVDVISMSIGGDFGQREQDISESITNIVQFGVVAVISAGNSGDIPYVVGEPSSAPEAISVAATTSVIATGIPLVVNSPAAIAGTYTNTATLDFAPITSTTTGNVVYVGRGCPGDTYLNPNVNGMVVLVDRGTCSVSLKIDAAANQGAIAVLVGLVAPGDAVPFSNGGGSNFVPSLVITQATSNLIKSALSGGAVNVTLSASNAISLSGEIASYSSRGPNYSYNMLKPDISAPGTVDAAEPGTGNGQTTESGTSFACPLTAGSAALLLSKNPTFTPLDVKALLMEASNATVYNNIATQPGYLAPMTRMGAGELRIDQTAAASTAAWDASDPLAVSLSFGTYRLNAPQTYKKKVVVRNYSAAARTYNIVNTYRDAPNSTGVTLSVPGTVAVPANSSAQITVSLLPTWTLNGGSNGSNGELLNTVEYAGYLSLTSGAENIHLPWHILPHKAAAVTPGATTITLNGNPATLGLSNIAGATAGQVDVFSLTGTGTQFPPAVALPPPGSDLAVTNLRAVGARLACTAVTGSTCTAFAAQFAVNTFGQRSHPDVPAEFDVYLDLNNDGTDDLVIFNADIGLVTAGVISGQNATFVYDLTNGQARGPYFLSIADLDSANVILTVPLSALVTSTSLKSLPNTPFTFGVYAVDNYYSGSVTDLITNMRYELDAPLYFASANTVSVPAGGATSITIFPNGPSPNSRSQTGMLLMYKDGKSPEADLITVNP